MHSGLLAASSILYPFPVAAFSGHLEAVKVLVGAGADCDAKTNRGKTAMAVAASRDHTEVVKFLEPHTAVGQDKAGKGDKEPDSLDPRGDRDRGSSGVLGGSSGYQGGVKVNVSMDVSGGSVGE
jgi:hypothetical protein